MRRKRQSPCQLTCACEYFPTYTIYLSLSMCPECTHSPACVETVFFLFFIFWSLWVLCLIFSNEPELFSNWPPTMYLGLEAFLPAILKFTHPPLSNLWDTICEDWNLCGTKFSAARAEELNRTSSPPGTASSQWAMLEDLDKEQKIPMCLRADLCFSACGGQGSVICASPRE